MRVFLTLCSLAAVALAKPQYNYGSGVSGTFGGSSGSSGLSSGGFGGFGGLGGGSSGSIGGGSALKFQGGNSGFSSGNLGGGSSSFGSGISSIGLGSLGGGSIGGGSIGGGSIGGGSIGGGSIGGGSFGGFQSSSSNYNQYSQQQQTGHFEAPIVHKQFITVAAPEDHENLERSKHLIIGRPQKNYRVVFIKAPSSSNANVKLSAEYAPQEEKTVIYVLSKKDSSLEVGDIATPAPTVPSKPEVFFIKYKTDEEAQHAQRQIQAEYDRIEGTSEHTDAGVAPQQSVVGILDNGAGVGAGGSAGSIGASSGSSGSFVSGGSSSGGASFGGSSSGGLISTGSSHNAAKSSAYLPPAGH